MSPPNEHSQPKNGALTATGTVTVKYPSREGMSMVSVPEPVDHGTGERIAAFEPDVLRRTRKHAEMGACIRAHIERGEGLAPFAPVSGGAQIGDLVHAEVADLGKGAVVADEVVVLVVPEQGIGAHVVPRAAAAQNTPAVPSYPV